MSEPHERSPITFAHRGGRAHFPENTLAAFRYAIDAGVTGLESDVFLTADDHVVLDHDGVVRSWFGLRRRPIKAGLRSALPSSVPTLDDLYELAGDRFHVSLDVKDVAAVDAVVERAQSVGGSALARLWLAHAGFRESDWRTVADWRRLGTELHLIDSTSVRRFDLPPGDYARRAADYGIDAINLPAREWDLALVDAVHAAGLLCLGFRANSAAAARKLVRLGLDGIYGDHVHHLLDAVQEREKGA